MIYTGEMYLDYLVSTPAIPLGIMWHPMPRIECVDGADVSIQRGSYSYCKPRNNEGPWSHMEAGFPSHTPPPSWMKYCEEQLSIRDKVKWYVFWRLKKPMFIQTVFPYMPIALIRDYITEHGGELPFEPPQAPIKVPFITQRQYMIEEAIKFIGGTDVAFYEEEEGGPWVKFIYRGDEYVIALHTVYAIYVQVDGMSSCVDSQGIIEFIAGIPSIKHRLHEHYSA